jgi:hypothetical protein
MQIMKEFLTVASVLLLVFSFGSGVFAQEEEIELTETYTSELGDVTIKYPEDWEVVIESGVTYIAKGGEDILEEPELPSGSAAFALLTPEVLALFGVEAGATLVETMASITEVMNEGDTVIDLEDAEEITLNNEDENEAIIIRVTDSSGDGIIAVVSYEAGIIGVLGIAPPGEYEDVESIIRAMLDTLVYHGIDESLLESMEPPEDNAVSWETDTVSLTASNFYITAGSQVFTADVDEVDVDGDPGDEQYTTLEVTWIEHDVEMRVFIYFEADGENWNAFEMRIYDGADPGEWVTFEDELFTAALGEAYSIGIFGRGAGRSTINFNDLDVQAFTAAE